MAERNFTLTLPAGMVDYIGNALAQRPYGEVAPVMAHIHRQVTEQTHASRSMTEDEFNAMKSAAMENEARIARERAAVPHPVAKGMAHEVDRYEAMRAHAAAADGPVPMSGYDRVSGAMSVAAAAAE